MPSRPASAPCDAAAGRGEPRAAVGVERDDHVRVARGAVEHGDRIGVGGLAVVGQQQAPQRLADGQHTLAAGLVERVDLGEARRAQPGGELLGVAELVRAGLEIGVLTNRWTSARSPGAG